ncbi:hypothetical protein BamMEX5DRAFT_4553 [Burkholderia ambifaria MEX-5]|uniref:Uncharacterized protein n=1 Tax=Burkholderia ambifaria MEX-5 TaxID=396597 RepID=B1T9T7_9BURK|nr:hypothetical protein BamMEX5DRAFT_4553 [Burkholderia ambifaria MEX-5]
MGRCNGAGGTSLFAKQRCQSGTDIGNRKGTDAIGSMNKKRWPVNWPAKKSWRSEVEVCQNHMP